MTAGAELGFRSELIFHRADGAVEDQRAAHDCRVIRTRSNPSFFWGNYLLFDRAPRTGDRPRWEELFQQLIAREQPESTHRAFGWIEDTPGEIDEFLAAGYRCNDTVVMQTVQIPSVPRPSIDAVRCTSNSTARRPISTAWRKFPQSARRRPSPTNG